MSKRKIRVIHPTDPVKVTFGAGDEYRYLATGDDTDGEYFLVEAIVPPEGGPPFHIQTREEEAFYILEGELTFYGEDGEVVAGPGTYLNIPKGAKHRFRNNRDQTAKMLFFFAPAGIEALFDALAEMDEPKGDFKSVIEALNVLGEKYGVEYLAE
jgi:mannose-6-phosphate isomerase-like protein (cupin superfamily)